MNALIRVKTLSINTIKQILPNNLNFIFLSILFGLIALVLGDYILFALPVFVLITLSYIYGERFVIALILISLFTLVGELNRSLRLVVHIVDFILLGYLFIKRFGFDLKNYPKVPKSVIFFFLFYSFVLFLSASMSKYPFAGVSLISKQIIFFFIAYIFFSLIQERKDINNYMLSITIVAIILVTISIVSLFQEGFNLVEIVSKNRTRVSALISNPEALTNFYVIAFPLLLTILLIKKNKNYKIVASLILLLLCIGLTLTMSRSAILGILLSSLIIIYILKKKRFYQIAFAIIFIGLIVILYPPFNETLTLFLRIEEGMSARDKLWDMSLKIINDNPIFGLGPGAYKYEYFNYLPFMLDDWWGKLMIYYYDVAEGVNFSHNYFLVFFSDMGIFGLVTAISLPIIYFNIGFKTVKKYKQSDSENYYLIISLFAAGISIIFRNFFNSIGLLFYGGITTDLPFWLIFASLIFYNNQPVKSSTSQN